MTEEKREGKYSESTDREILIKAYEHALQAKKNTNFLVWVVIINIIISILF